MSEVEEILKKITSHKGVEGYVIVNSKGIPIRSNLSNDLKVKYAGLISQLVAKANTVVHEISMKTQQQNELTFLRLRTKIHEILIAPGLKFV